jgi:hypothetical protein
MILNIGQAPWPNVCNALSGKRVCHICAVPPSVFDGASRGFMQAEERRQELLESRHMTWQVLGSAGLLLPALGATGCGVP